VSGVALVLVLVLAVLVWRATVPGHPARVGALLSVVAIVIEALIGAAIVLAEWVADDASVARVVAVPLHLVNTLFLLAVLTLTVFWLSGGGRLDFRSDRRVTRLVLIGAAALVALAATGAVTALADTLFPKTGGDLETTAHFLTRMRVIHPVLAVVAAIAGWVAVSRSPLPEHSARLLPALVGAMLLTGAVNVLLGTPVHMQLLHLALADVLWVTYVWVSAVALSGVTVSA
jgi:heme A synthase